MNVKPAQIIALITHGNEYLYSDEKDLGGLFPSHSTFNNVSDISFRKDKTSGKSYPIDKNTHAWFSHLKDARVGFLKLDLLNLQELSYPYAPGILTSGNAWVIQTDTGKGWQSIWSLQNEMHIQSGIWKVEYWENDNIPVIVDPLNIETVHSDLKASLLDA